MLNQMEPVFFIWAECASQISIWDIGTGEVLQEIMQHYHGAVNAVAPVKLQHSKLPAFICGCADGTIHLFKRKESNIRLSDFIGESHQFLI